MLGQPHVKFDYLHDPVLPQLEYLQGLRIPPRLYAPLITLCITCIAALSTVFIEQRRVDDAANVEARSQAQYNQLRARLARFQLTSAQTTDLIALDRRLQDIRESGYRQARLLADIAIQLPERSWLTSVAPHLLGTEIVGRTFDLETVGNVIQRLSGTQLGEARLQRVTANGDNRTQTQSQTPQLQAQSKPQMQAQLEFDIVLQK
jgi:Tfp pilus assembly protein PilN